ncbi:MAG: formyltransferase family protein [Bacteroidales bacterium]|nr:formyltransferase family protein [Bacteroidales bacterium]
MPVTYKTIKNNQSAWGTLYTPLKPKTDQKKGLRTVLFVSCDCGNLMLGNLAHFESLYPGKLNIVGIVTDDPIDPAARISIKKRVWSQFSFHERSTIFQRLINSAMEIGVSCYSGAVKTDYFRNIYREWNPEALFMFCFGQKIDSVLYDFPSMGAYNFHPSDLPGKIGAGTQPFQNAMQNGLKSSPMVIHQVTEIIDVGPIIGVSPSVNICLEDGSYPASIRTLLDKITSLGGWMGVALADAIVSRKENGLTGVIEPIDFNKIMPESVKTKIQMPATNDLNEKYELPLHPLLSK